jgi:hypothetical protein
MSDFGFLPTESQGAGFRAQVSGFRVHEWSCTLNQIPISLSILILKEHVLVSPERRNLPMGITVWHNPR